MTLREEKSCGMWIEIFRCAAPTVSFDSWAEWDTLAITPNEPSHKRIKLLLDIQESCITRKSNRCEPVA
jgi:hypothetical protein